MRKSLGFVKSDVDAGGFRWSYLEKNDATDQDNATSKPVVVFVHGFSSEKDSWMNVAKYVPPSARVLIPDLPGHGMTSPMLATGNYRAAEQARHLKSFLDATVGPNTPVHLVGCSMGGLISGVFAATYPDQLHSLTLICPAGVSMPRKSPVLKLYEDEGKNVMRAGTVDGIMELGQYVSHHPPNLDLVPPKGVERMVLGALANYRAERMPVIDKILQDLMEDKTALEQNLHRIQAKTVVLWGENDQILDVSCLDRMEALQGEKVVIPECGHLVQHVVPQLCADHIIRFIAESHPSAVSRVAP
ncbi:hypothetical protein DYB32_007479 [Aphanomyces invadans]|uniref:AB hydrolase-1 domain-containing protein n=1 Tax=Aphanomyces invadans TaxID=157072 RepID=A0A3R6VI05_9STRA|nr:hypothetical protein DYB32_007479 [Aphanomyces invadans]